MIEYIEGDIFSSPVQVIVNTVNTVGVMGKGLALEYKKRYPKMFELYRNVCEKRQLNIGKLMLYYASDHWILLFPTKENWRNPSKLEYIEAGMEKFSRIYAQKNITSIAFPKLGCGNGELLWEDVRPVMEKYLKPLPITVYIYMGLGSAPEPEHKQPEATMEWLRSHARDMSFLGLCDDLIHGQAIAPYQISCGSKTYAVYWKEGLEFCDEQKETIFLSKQELSEVWNDVRKNGIFSVEACPAQEKLFFLLLHQLGYLSPVRILNERSTSMKKGYQINEGSGRLFGLRGEEK